MFGFEVKERDQSTVDLFDLGQAGYTVLRPSDLDWTHAPWLIDRDGNLWIYDAGMPATGYKPNTHAVYVNDDGSWNYLTAAAASGRENAPKDRAELERRARDAQEQTERQAAEQERHLGALRKTAQPVTSGDLDRALSMTLAQAAEHIDRAGGKLEVHRDRLVVSLPPGAGKLWSSEPLDAARVLYLAEGVVVPLVKSGKPLPDAPITPAGALLA